MSSLRLWSIGVVATVALGGCSAEPRSPQGKSSSPAAPTSQPVSIPTVLILDASGSMTTPDAPGPRIDAAKSAAKGLVDGLPDTKQIGLVTYGTGTGSSDAEEAAGCQDDDGRAGPPLVVVGACR